MWNQMMNPAGMMPWMIVGQVVIWTVVVVGLVLITREIAGALRARRDTPLALLQRRLTSGEISREEYDSVRRILEEPSGREAPRTPSLPPRSIP